MVMMMTMGLVYVCEIFFLRSPLFRSSKDNAVLFWRANMLFGFLLHSSFNHTAADALIKPLLLCEIYFCDDGDDFCSRMQEKEKKRL